MRVRGCMRRAVLARTSRSQSQESWSVYIGRLGTSLEATQGQILRQSPTDATRFWWHVCGS